MFPVNLKEKIFSHKTRSDLVNFLERPAASDLDISVGNKAEVVLPDDGDGRGVQSAGVLGYVVVFNSNLF